jgi:uncharacterized membrane protein SirB2
LIRAVYALLKGVHVGAVVLSGAGFVLRYASLPPEPARRPAWVRIAPHAVDVVLLASALGSHGSCMRIRSNSLGLAPSWSAWCSISFADRSH